MPEVLWTGTMGLSPLARRNHATREILFSDLGPISAGAEEPPLCVAHCVISRAYLRWRGGTITTAWCAVRHSGLSPLARRNLPVMQSSGQRQGPISAGAEEPLHPTRSTAHMGAYLRWRGGTAWCIARKVISQGLSPLARRNRAIFKAIDRGSGPISAGAEEPSTTATVGWLFRAYLRWRGGTTSKH